MTRKESARASPRQPMKSDRIIETGTVVGLSEAGIEVAISASEACAKCGLCGRRENGLMSITVRAGENPPQPGERVRLVFPWRTVWKQTFFVFAVPLVLMLCGIVIAAGAVAGLDPGGVSATLITVAGALVGLGAGVLCTLFYEARFRRRVWAETLVEREEAP